MSRSKFISRLALLVILVGIATSDRLGGTAATLFAACDDFSWYTVSWCSCYPPEDPGYLGNYYNIYLYHCDTNENEFLSSECDPEYDRTFCYPPGGGGGGYGGECTGWGYDCSQAWNNNCCYGLTCQQTQYGPACMPAP